MGRCKCCTELAPLLDKLEELKRQDEDRPVEWKNQESITSIEKHIRHAMSQCEHGGG